MNRAIAQAVSADPLWERIVVAAVGPAITVLIGGLAVWLLTSSVQRRRERADLRRAEAREDALRQREEHARDDALRHELVAQMSASAAALYLLTQHYWRTKKHLHNHPDDEAAEVALEGLRSRLDAEYLAQRAAGDALEHRLAGFFDSDAPRREWHRVQDLLTLRYFQLVDRATVRLYEDNEGPDHSGLRSEEMSDPKNITRAYRVAMDRAVDLVFTEPLRSRSLTGPG